MRVGDDNCFCCSQARSAGRVEMVYTHRTERVDGSTGIAHLDLPQTKFAVWNRPGRAPANVDEVLRAASEATVRIDHEWDRFGVQLLT